MASDQPVAGPLLLIAVGAWLLTQTLIGDLPGRVRSWALGPK